MHGRPCGGQLRSPSRGLSGRCRARLWATLAASQSTHSQGRKCSAGTLCVQATAWCGPGGRGAALITYTLRKCRRVTPARRSDGARSRHGPPRCAAHPQRARVGTGPHPQNAGRLPGPQALLDRGHPPTHRALRVHDLGPAQPPPGLVAEGWAPSPQVVRLQAWRLLTGCQENPTPGVTNRAWTLPSGVGPASPRHGPFWARWPHSGQPSISTQARTCRKRPPALQCCFPPITKGSALHGKPITCEQNTAAGPPAHVSHRVGGRLSSIVGSLGSVSALGVAESLW